MTFIRKAVDHFDPVHIKRAAQLFTVASFGGMRRVAAPYPMTDDLDNLELATVSESQLVFDVVGKAPGSLRELILTRSRPPNKRPREGLANAAGPGY